MKLKDIFSLLSVNQPIKIVTGKDAILYSGAYEIPKDMIDRKLLHIAHDKDGIILYVEKMWYGYDRLDTKAKINALYITDRAVSKWERGLSLPDISILENLSGNDELIISDDGSSDRTRELIQKYCVTVFLLIWH